MVRGAAVEGVGRGQSCAGLLSPSSTVDDDEGQHRDCDNRGEDRCAGDLLGVAVAGYVVGFCG